jgi:NAD+ kinase
MKFAVVSWNKVKLEQEIRNLGFSISRKKPDIVICVGGDGTLLFGEIEYPGVPKLFIYHKCKSCKRHWLKDLLTKLDKGQYKISKELKVQGIVNGSPRKKLVGLNEILIHNKPPCAITLKVWMSKVKPIYNVEGDGIMVSSPYGSTGYFKSLTRRIFKKGVGLAFNNPVKATKERVLPEKTVVKAKVLKGQGWMVADCNKKLIPIKEGDTIEIKAHPKPAQLITIRGKKKLIL